MVARSRAGSSYSSEGADSMPTEEVEQEEEKDPEEDETDVKIEADQIELAGRS